MTRHLTDPLDCFRFKVPVGELLETAQARLRRQSQYARPLAKGGSKAAGIAEWITQASDCISDLARPEAVFTPLKASVEGGSIRIADCITLSDPNLVSRIERGGTLSAYALTLGYCQQAAFDWLKRDYMAHHIQTDLGRETLFALGRHAHRAAQSLAPERRLRRISVQTQGPSGARMIWDAKKIQTLLSCFGDENPGISVTGTGCFQPLNSLLGLVVAL